MLLSARFWPTRDSATVSVFFIRDQVTLAAQVIHERGWECFAAYHDELAAGVVVDYLRRNDCPAQVAGRAGAGPDAGVQVIVPGELLHRARWLWAQADLTEAELHYLISGELPGE